MSMKSLPLVHNINMIRLGGFFMRKLVLALIFLLLFNTETMFTEGVGLTNNELLDITNIILEDDHTIEGWNVTFKEKLSSKHLERVIKLLREEHQSLQVIDNEDTIKYYAQTTNGKKEEITESYHIVVPKNRQNSPEFSVSLEGSQWNDDQLLNYQLKSAEILRKYFTRNVERFTCVIATNNAIIREINFLKTIKNKLNLKNISTQIDTIDYSIRKKIIYGFTPKWDKNINVLDHRLNIQIVFQNFEDENPKMIIGTPILISEY